MNTCGGLGQVSVSCLHSSHSGSRCTTSIVLGPDFNRSVLVAYDIENYVWETPGSTASIPMIEVGLRANNLYFVRPHNRWKVTQQRTLTREYFQQRNTQILLSHWEPYSTSHVALQLEMQLRKNLGIYTPTTKAQTLPLTGKWQRAKKEALLNIQGSLWSLQEQSHLLSRQ